LSCGIPLLELTVRADTTDLLGLPSSLLLGVPIPAAFHAVGIKLQAAVEQAVLESIENGMSKSGKRVTPWLLGRVAELTKGDSLASNVALIKNNVKVGGEIAWELARILRERTKVSPEERLRDES
jgi:pseudouridine-5'-phosphate glycosidase/pseudouridine kinase